MFLYLEQEKCFMMKQFGDGIATLYEIVVGYTSHSLGILGDQLYDVMYWIKYSKLFGHTHSLHNKLCLHLVLSLELKGLQALVFILTYLSSLSKKSGRAPEREGERFLRIICNHWRELHTQSKWHSPALYLSIYLSIYLPACLSAYLPIIYLSACLSAYLPAYFPAFLPTYHLSICLPVCLFIYLSVRPSIYLSVLIGRKRQADVYRENEGEREF